MWEVSRVQTRRCPNSLSSTGAQCLQLLPLGAQFVDVIPGREAFCHLSHSHSAGTMRKPCDNGLNAATPACRRTGTALRAHIQGLLYSGAPQSKTEVN